MSLLREIRKLIYTREAESGGRPEFIPLTKVECVTLAADPMVCMQCPRPEPDQIFNTPVWETPFAAQIRERQISFPTARFFNESKSDRLSNLTWGTREDEQYRYRRLKADICKNTTQLTVKLEWDPLAKLKRRLHLTKWFPVKTRTVVIDGTVLYPFLDVQLPHNRHFVTFQLVK